MINNKYDFMESLFDNSKFFILEMSDSKGSALDIGCGSGILAYKLSKYYDKVIGIDTGVVTVKRKFTTLRYIFSKLNIFNF
ncbi:methyltransferase (plasmid) [Clostridium estertheticum]|uniref:methyltransferase n=1 Tax=Clostridium estertheticum TaxID=238834 RepID=UPI001C0CA83C|nr:methyltransferase [Clostridium estertheticum]MBU3217393.1 methyltransferase [Clostridium estertheticum]WAG58168.1 methyltransferase [Clostridium estertheticum]